VPVVVFERSVTGALAFDSLVGEWTSDFALLVADRLDLEGTGGDTVGFAHLMAGPSFVLTAVGVPALDFECALADCRSILREAAGHEDLVAFVLLMVLMRPPYAFS
jgi:hypothetical protein